MVVRYRRRTEYTGGDREIRLLSPSGERVSLAQLTKVESQRRRLRNLSRRQQRYVAIKFSVRGRDLGTTVEEAMRQVDAESETAARLHLDWSGEYESEKRAEARLLVDRPADHPADLHHPLHHVPSFKWALLILVNVAMARVGGLLALLVTRTNFSVSSGVGFLALFGVSVQTGVIMLEYINQLRARGYTDRGRGGRRRGPAAAPHHDDHAGGDAGPAARGALARHRLRLAAALRHRHRRRTDLRPGHEHLPVAHSSTSGLPASGDKLPEPEASFEESASGCVSTSQYRLPP